MKKQLLSAVIFATLGSASIGVQAAPAQGLLEWTGFVDGIFNSTEIALTGQGGGDIQKGLLNIQETGEFTSARAIVVEAHKTIDNAGVIEADADLYEGDVNWNLANQSVSHSGYDVNSIEFGFNGTLFESGTTLTTLVGEHIVGITVNYKAAADVNPGDAVQVSATILAEPSV